MGISCSACKCDDEDDGTKRRRGRKRAIELSESDAPRGHEFSHSSSAPTAAVHSEFGSSSKIHSAEHQAVLENRLGSLRDEAGRLEQVARGLQVALQPPEAEKLGAENAALRAELQKVTTLLSHQQHAGQEEMDFLRSQLRLRESENEVLRRRMVSSAMHSTVDLSKNNHSNVNDQTIDTERSLPFIEAPGYLREFSLDAGKRAHHRVNSGPFSGNEAHQHVNSEARGVASAPIWDYGREFSSSQTLPRENGTAQSLPPFTPMFLPENHGGDMTRSMARVPSPPLASSIRTCLPQAQRTQRVEPILENSQPLFSSYMQSLAKSNQSLPGENRAAILTGQTLNGSLLAEMLGPAREEWLQAQKQAAFS